MIERIAEALWTVDETQSSDWRDTAELIWLAAHMTSSAGSVELEPQVTPAPSEALIKLASWIERLKALFSWGEKPAKQRQAARKQKQVFAGSADSTERSTQRGVSLRAPVAPALPARLDVARGLKPLRRRVPSRTAWEIDEEATIDRIAETGIWQPVVRASLERWLDVALVVDRSTSMAIWQSTVVEFRRLLERLGAFRSLRHWTFNSDNPDQVSLHRVSANGAASRERSIRELSDPSGRLLILLVSDCVGSAWQSGTVASLFKPLMRSSSMAIVQMLPPRLWDRTGLEPGTIWLEADAPARPASRLKRDARRNSRFAPTGMTLPVVRLERESISQWASFVATESHALVSGRVLGRGEFVEDNEKAASASDPAAVLRAFRSASPTAQELASYLSVAPLTLPVMRLVQRAMLPQSSQPHLAEFFLSGMLWRLSSPDIPAEQSLYDFLPTLRDKLRSSVTLTKQLAVIDAVSEYITREVGARDTFGAVVAGLRGDTPISGGMARHFAHLTADALERLGPRYRNDAARLRQAASGEMSKGVSQQSDEAAELQEQANTWSAVTAILKEIGVDEDWTVNLTMNLPVGLFSRRVWVPSGLTQPELIVFLVGALTGSDYVQFFSVAFGAKGPRIRLMADTIKPPKVHYTQASPDGIIGGAVLSNQAQWLPDVETDFGYIAAEPSTRAEFALPVCQPGEPPKAVINIEFETEEALDEPDREWLVDFARALGDVDLRLPRRVEDFVIAPPEAQSDLEYLLGRARTEQASGDHDRAVEIYTQILGQRPSAPSAMVLTERATAYWYAHRYKEALRDCDRVIDMNGKTPDILFVRGQILAEMGRKRAREAIRDLDVALTEKMGPSEGYALRARAFAYAQLGLWKQADADIERSLALASDNAWTYYTLAQMCELRHQQDKALDHYKTALTKENPPLNTPKRDLALQRLKELA